MSRKNFLILVLVFIFTATIKGFCIAQSTKIAVSPFSIQAPPDLNYLQKGVQNLLVSRLSVPGAVEAFPLKKAIEPPLSSEALSAETAGKIQKSVNANYLLTGSITAIGQSISIDSWLYNLSSTNPPQKFSIQGSSLNDVMGQINQLAKNISSSMGIASTEVASLRRDSQSQEQSKVMDVLSPALTEGQSISYLNPNFIEITPEESFQNIGVWRSQPISEGIVGMDVGDIDGDRQNEIVTVSYKKLTVYKRHEAGLRTIASFEAPQMHRFIWCSLIDLNGDKKEEIVVTALKFMNLTVGGYESNMSKVEKETSTPSAMVFSMEGNSLRPIVKNIPYFLNTLQLPEGDKILIGQKQAPEKGFDKAIYDMRLRGQNLEPVQKLSLPSKCNVFNFVQADLNNDGIIEHAIILPDNRLIVTKGDGPPLWKSRHRFGATTNYVIGKAQDLRYNQQEYYYIPTPILVTDLNKDGIKELVTNRSPDYSRFLPAGFKYYESGQVVSLSWDQMGMIENWTTREMPGMVTSVRIADTNGDGKLELVTSVVMGKELLEIWKTESVILSYDLNLERRTRTSQK